MTLGNRARSISSAARRHEHAVQLAKGGRFVDEVADEPHDGPLEPAVAERELLCVAPV